MSALLDSLLTPQQRADAAAADARQANKLHPLFDSILARHFPLPGGPYPSAQWPHGCTHLPEGSAK